MIAILFIPLLFDFCAARSPNFSIFSVVRFENNQCRAISEDNLNGICLTNDECNSAGGTVDGNCASGFGVCCVLYVRDCSADASITKNGSYIVNKDYPSASTTKGQTCTFNVNSAAFADTICQLRLDFDTLKISTPSNIGDCSAADTFAVTSPSGRNPPTYCGDISGSHMYVETARQEAAATVKFTISSNDFSRKWRVKVSYIDCYSQFRAPNDCQQYYTGVSGTFSSYGWINNQILTINQEFTTCIRQEEGFCAIDFSVPDSGTSPDYFSVSDTQIANAQRTAGSCNKAALQFTPAMSAQDDANGIGNLFCGGQFASIQKSTTSAIVRSDAIPFNVRLVIQGNIGSLDPWNIGYSIDWRQVPCGNV